MRVASGRAGKTDGEIDQPQPARPPGRTRSRWAVWLEGLGVVLSPAIAALVLRLRLMAPTVLPDPSMHTIFMVAPRDVYTRYAAVYASTARMREGARVGFLVPGRLAYLAFGPVPGFFVLRYVFALIAVVPIYLLLRRLYGPPVGVAGILVVLSSPVIATALGTDYPDGAVVSYVAGALACLAMPSSQKRRRWWLAAGGALLMTAVWSHGVAVPLAGATLAGYVGVRLVRDRAGLLVDLVLLAGVAAAVTGLLAAASAALFGHANFITLAWQGYRFLSRPSQTAQWHSANWRWVLYVSYLLVPPAVVVAFVAVVARRIRTLPTPVLLVGVVATAQLVVFALMQFAGSVQTLEQHYLSSTLWAGVCLLFAVTVAEIARPLSERRFAQWLPPAVLLAVPLVYEAYPHVAAFGWEPAGLILAATVIAAAVAAAITVARLRRPMAAATATGLSLAVFAGASLVLTVAPAPPHPHIANVSTYLQPSYATALGGSGAIYIDAYRIATALPVFTGPAAYPGEQLLMWRLTPQPSLYVTDAVGMYHDGFNRLHSHTPALTPIDRRLIKHRRAAQLLFLGRSTWFPAALHSLAAFKPTVTRTGTLRGGPLVLHVWLVRLGVYYHPPAHAS